MARNIIVGVQDNTGYPVTDGAFYQYVQGNYVRLLSSWAGNTPDNYAAHYVSLIIDPGYVDVAPYGYIGTTFYANLYQSVYKVIITRWLAVPVTMPQLIPMVTVSYGY
jgi:hypothetical protein